MCLEFSPKIDQNPCNSVEGISALYSFEYLINTINQLNH